MSYVVLVALIAGWFLPIVELRYQATGGSAELLIAAVLGPQGRAVSIVDGIRFLFVDGRWFIGLGIACFSVLFPLAKSAYMLVLLHCREGIKARELQAISRLGPLSTLDSLVVAMLIAAYVAFPSFLKAGPGPGFWFFLAAIVANSVVLKRLPLRWGCAAGTMEKSNYRSQCYGER
jgi:uncharacterized paraquat-inducible protein A